MWIRPSNEARYLTGFLGLTEGLQRARSFLMHPFPQNMFASLGATPTLPIERVQPSINRLRKLSVNKPAFDLRNERERSALGHLSVSRPREFVTFEHLKAKWQEHREGYWRECGKPTPQSGDETDWDQLEGQTLDDALIWMRGRQIIFQGY